MKCISFLLLIIPIQSYLLNNFKKGMSSIILGSNLIMSPVQEIKPILSNNIDYVDKYDNYKYENYKYDSNKYSNSFENEKTIITTDKNNIYFYGTVTPESCRVLGTKLQELINSHKQFKNDFKTEPPPINLHLQSPGGSLINTFYVLDILIKSEVPIHTYVDGYVASAASLISVVGKKRFMTENSMIMIHQLSSGNEGKFKELDDEMMNLNTFMSMIKKVYLKHTNIIPVKLDDILEHDLWLDSKKCLEFGLVDEII